MKRAENPDAMQQRATQYTSEWSGLLDPTRAARDTPTLGHPPRYANPPKDTPTPQIDNWPRGVTVSTLDSESSDRGSNPREASACQMLTCTNVYMRSYQNNARWP